MQASLVDIHCEATSEKMALGHFCDGRVSAVIGTHTHVPTSDAMILPKALIAIAYPDWSPAASPSKSSPACTHVFEAVLQSKILM